MPGPSWTGSSARWTTSASATGWATSPNRNRPSCATRSTPTPSRRPRPRDAPAATSDPSARPAGRRLPQGHRQVGTMGPGAAPSGVGRMLGGRAARRRGMRTAARRTAEGLVVAGGVVLLRPGTRANKVVCRSVDEAGRRLRYAGGRLQGLSYRLGGRHPDPHVGDNVLADRIRSSVGGLEKRLDLPHVHVTVERGVAVLHGEVGSAEDARQLERAVEAVSGVAGVESYLHVGLGAGDTRPS
ncbi:BON domain-containing protein, partial [Acidimicrobiaceae bacterium USS-CC1]|nr:BON domain-containing protein [Acidiferrimicrobium australe]